MYHLNNRCLHRGVAVMMARYSGLHLVFCWEIVYSVQGKAGAENQKSSIYMLLNL
jgi:hypothetical protein